MLRSIVVGNRSIQIMQLYIDNIIMLGVLVVAVVRCVASA